MKKIVILEHGGGELANQLWNYASIYAFALERGIEIKNPSFFEYHSSFRFLPLESALTRLYSAFFKTPRRRSHPLNRIGRFKYRIQSNVIGLLKRPCIVSSENNENKATYLPPTGKLRDGFDGCDTLYFKGWLFRNPNGLTAYRGKLVELFRPQEKIEDEIHDFIRGIRAHYAHVIGVHIRQGDYSTFKKGRYLIGQERAGEILRQYLSENRLETEKTCFIICSDGNIDTEKFDGLTIRVSHMTAVHDLFLLSKTDAILGSDSSFSDFAAWYGNIPHIVFQKGIMDWEYYRGKRNFFENRYSTLVQY